MKLKVAIAKMRKAIVAALAIVVLQFLHKAGIQVDSDTVQVILDAVIVSGVTYAVPNAAPLLDQEDGNG